MTHPLISAQALRALMASGAPLLVLDCSFDLSAPDRCEAAYAERHLPGALYVHLDRDLSAAKNGRNGRHPLPSAQAFAERMGRLGLDDRLHVVAYDTAGGMYAARLWWMLRWIGHADVQVLDGGLAAWDGAGGALVGGPVPPRPAGQCSVRPSLARNLSFEEVLAGLGQGRRLVVDARAPDRFRGENETLDPVGGHIPGAGNRFFRENLAANGQFKPADHLRAEWLALMGERSAVDLVAQCGSGVTACHNLLALEAAGLAGASLYAGSWSEWCAHPEAPMAIGS